ncbi:MAG: cytochrome c biogenesis heme-transporting ATPase CcmA [Burkholderiales bacterium]|nr:MAG: cytochrome c biogenesis heme-transporting ATPase CcmA [Burkholderiales bacterium]
MSAPLLRVSELACTLGYRTLFSDLGFELDAGQWMMLTGANGAGKSTLLRVLAGLVAPTAGSVCWYGTPRRAEDPDWHARLVYQGHAFGWKDALTTTENLAMQAALDLGVGHPATRGDAIEGALERVGLARQRKLAFARLSAGQRRRLGLARLVLVRRPLWLLDEPTTALDTDGQRLFARLLEGYLGAGGCAVIATHLEFPTTLPAVALRLGEVAGAAAGARPASGPGAPLAGAGEVPIAAVPGRA